MFFKRNKLKIIFFCSLFLCIYFLDTAVTSGESLSTQDLASKLGDVTQGKMSAIGKPISFIVGFLASAALLLFGWIASMIIAALLFIVKYNNFINEPMVVQTWVMVRDFCNLFFILVLLIIAFGTILRVKGYTANDLLKKVVIAAIMINFSKMICGIMIDLGQVVMLTFVNAFADGGGNLINAFQVKNPLSFNSGDDAQFGWDSWSISMSLVMGALFLLITTVVLGVITGVLLVRIIALWTYTMLSPFAFILSTFPAGQKYANKWWDEFGNYIIVGPMLSFFLWLALSVGQIGQDITKGQTCYGGSNITCEAPFMSYIIAIAIVMFGLKTSQSVAGMASGVIGGGIGKINQMGSWTKKQTIGRAQTAAWNKTKSVTSSAWNITRGVGKAVDIAIGSLMGKIVSATKERPISTIAGFALGSLAGSPVGGLIGAKMANTLQKRVSGYLRRKKENALNLIADKHIEEENGVKVERRFSSDVSDKNLYRTNGNGELLNNKGDVVKDVSGKTYTVDQIKNGYVHDSQGNIITNAQGWSIMSDVDTISNQKRMSEREKSIRSAYYSHTTKGDIMQNAAEEKKVEDMRKDYAWMNTSMIKKLMEAEYENDKKMAMALELAVKKGFENNGDVKKIKAAFSGNDGLLGKFNDEIDKRQAHLNYDLTQNYDRTKFKDRIEDGKIDATKLAVGAYKDKNVIAALQDHFGKDFGRIIETSYKRGRQYEGAVADGLKAAIDKSNLYDSSKNELDSAAKALAKLTGDIKGAFTGTSGLNLVAVQKYIESANAATLNKISANKIDITAGNANEEVSKVIIASLAGSDLDSMRKQGDNPALIKKIKDLVIADKSLNPKLAEFIDKNTALNSL